MNQNQIKKKAQELLWLNCLLLSEPSIEEIEIREEESGWSIKCNACHEECSGFITKNGGEKGGKEKNFNSNS